MRKLALSLLALFALVAGAQAQNVSWPPPGGTIAFLCVYNAVAPTMTTGSAGYAQCDINGQIKTTGGGGGGGGGAITAASGSYAAGAMSAGSYAAGALVAGAALDGWDVTQGAKADAVCATATGTCSTIALLKFLNNAATSAIPAGTALIGDVNLRQGGTALSATNGIFSNLLQGNAVLSATNGTFANLLVGNAAVATGTGATGATSPRFTVAVDSATVGGSATLPAGTNRVGYTSDDPCDGASAKTTVPITLATAAVKVIAVGVSAKKIYVCQLNLNNNAADTVAVFEATTATVCATSPVAVIGAGTSVATAGTGYNFAATGGISLGNGRGQVLQTSVNANDLCVAQSAATQLSGSITYVTQ